MVSTTAVDPSDMASAAGDPFIVPMSTYAAAVISTGLSVLRARPGRFPRLVWRFLGGEIGPDAELRSSVQRQFQKAPMSQVRLRHGVTLFIDPEDTSFLSPNIAILGYYESATTEIWRLLVQDAGVVVDVGANIGWFTITAASSAPRSSRIVAFEPEARAFGLLTQSVAGNGFPNVTLVPQAAWSTAGLRTLHLSPDSNRGSHSLTRAGEGPATTIPCVRIDDHLQALGIDQVDVMKIDVEGAEPQALEGCSKLIEKGRVRNLILEWNPDGWMGREAQLDELFRRFDVFRFDPSVPFRRLPRAELPLANHGPLSYLYLRLRTVRSSAPHSRNNR
ncbi:MAG: FkbM family methyltransferase [Thermoplasmata archaeon]|nr:FkbM family methyltransferase [Thermoplasmata archaeon]